MVKRARAALAVLLLLLAAGVWAVVGLGTGDPGPARSPVRGAAESKEDLPRIGLGRLAAPRGEVEVGKRDLFAYGRPLAVATTPAPRPSPTAPSPIDPTALAAGPVGAAAGPRAQAPASLAYMGSVERQGTKVAVLLMDEKEVVTGQVGQVVGNRFRIVEIGLESVDIQDVGSDRVRRIPLKGK